MKTPYLRSKCLVLALAVNTFALAVTYGLSQLWWQTADEAVVYVVWLCMYPIITVALYKYFRRVGTH
jgi:membrane protein YdbS with pleckstrin-like domain